MIIFCACSLATEFNSSDHRGISLVAHDIFSEHECSSKLHWIAARRRHIGHSFQSTSYSFNVGELYKSFAENESELPVAGELVAVTRFEYSNTDWVSISAIARSLADVSRKWNYKCSSLRRSTRRGRLARK